MSLSVAIDNKDLSVTPVFQYITVEDVPASEREGQAVMRTIEAVEVRIAGQRNYAPIFPVDAVYRREGLRMITYAERWADQYADFVAGNSQIASGTPLEMLRPFGITESLLSLCRALKIYSVEALHSLEGQAAKSLGMHANTLKEMAAKYMGDTPAPVTADDSRIAELEAKIAALMALSGRAPGEAEADAALAAADVEKVSGDVDEYADLRARYQAAAGTHVRGKPNLETLRKMVAQAEGK